MTRYNTTTQMNCDRLTAEKVVRMLNGNIRGGRKVTFKVESRTGRNFENTVDMGKLKRFENGIITIKGKRAADLYIKPIKGYLSYKDISHSSEYFSFEGVEMQLNFGREHFWQKRHNYFTETKTKYRVLVRIHDGIYLS